MSICTAQNLAEKLLPEAKKWIRRSVSSLDTEIQQTVAACILDLENVGVVKFRDDDPLIQQATKLYLKAHFGYDDKAEKWAAAYEHLKASLSLSGTYTEGSANG